MPNPTPELPEDLKRIFEKLDSIRDHAAELERRLKIATDALERIWKTPSLRRQFIGVALAKLKEGRKNEV